MKKNCFLLLILFLIYCEIGIASEADQSTTDTATTKEISATDKFFEETKQAILRPLWKTFGFDGMKKIIADELIYDPDRLRPASVKTEPKNLSSGSRAFEASFLNKRLPKVQQAFQQYSGIKISDQALTPRIGIVLSGGGYRSLVLSAGYMKAFKDLGIEALYISTLSGSTWWLGPYILEQAVGTMSVDSFNNVLREKIKKNTFNLIGRQGILSFDRLQFANDIIFPKIVFEQIVSTVDFWGGALTNSLLDQFQYPYRQKLSNQYQMIKDGSMPWPIYTAVSMHNLENNYIYNWYEFNPEEVRNLELDLAIPAFSFGRKFMNGQAIKTHIGDADYYAPEQSFGYLMGIFGSAYTTNLDDLYRLFFNKINPKTVQAEQQGNQGIGLLSKIFAQKGDFYKNILNVTQTNASLIKQAVMNEILGDPATGKSPWFSAKTVIDIARGTPGGKLRVSPAQIANPFKGLSKIENLQWLYDRDFLTFVDAGIHYNIPLRPMFVPERKLDLIIIADASGNVYEGTIELQKAFNDIYRKYGVYYSKENHNVSDSIMSVYHPDNKHEKFPVIVYFNFKVDKNLFDKDSTLKLLVEQNKLKEFDPKKCLENFCSTFNFNYTLDQFNQLAALAEFNIKSHAEALKKIITGIFIQKKEVPDIELGF